ncbi:hypothetical protein CK203_023101 [Vitis vinifera]|uniref:Uncharacterized protein n=1 Tax=Vitis vinifera TaxID=29760 RepID=A0A438J448_VITVI|nr:hypothetical protein CK203_023101 [Vitis vinifera]
MSKNVTSVKACPHTTYAVRDVETNFRPLALRAVGHGHSRTPTSRSCPEEVSYSSPRIISVNGWKLKHTLASKTKMSPKATNKTLITALKKRLEQAKGKWVEELPDVLWAYRTTPGRPTGNTPFALAYGMDAIIPTDIGLPTIRTEAGRQDDANAELGRNLDWTDEVRETTSIQMADYQQRAAAHYNRKASPGVSKVERWFLERFSKTQLRQEQESFKPIWEDPYIVAKTSESGAYHLQKLDGTPLLRPWNVSNLKQYYQ